MNQSTMFQNSPAQKEKVSRPLLSSRESSFYSYYNQLNSEQKKAVDTISGPVMVLAGPGTGKTQLLSVRVANILRQTDLYPSNILVLTYTNAGVKAMRERLAKMIGPDGYDVVVETFHSFANWIITESEEAADIMGDRVEMTELERIKLIEHLLDNLDGMKPIRPPAAPYLYRRDIVSTISDFRRDGVTSERLHHFLKTFTPDGTLYEQKHVDRLTAFAKVFEAYENSKKPNNDIGLFDERGRYDFDDMILFAAQLLEHDEQLLAKHREQFQYIMVDEFQDSNGSQLELLSILTGGDAPNLCMVGDDDQSIYRFQGASAGNFHLMETLFPSITKVALTENYRSLKGILDKSAEIIRQVPSRERVVDKELVAVRGEDKGESVSSFIFGTEQEELTFLVSQIQKLEKKDMSNTAILVRTRKQAQIIIDAFLQAGISYATDGKEDIRGEERIQQLLKIIRLAENGLHFEQKDLLLFEVLLSDFLEIPHSDIMKFVVYVNGKKNAYKKSYRRKTSKETKEYVQEEQQHSMGFADVMPFSRKDNKPTVKEVLQPSLFSELLLRFPAPNRIHIENDTPPNEDETLPLTICQELDLEKPVQLHRAAWAIRRLLERAPSYPVHPLVLHFINDVGLIDFILQTYEENDVVRLRDLRAISSFVENLHKATTAKPDILLKDYLIDLEQLEKHDISFRGEMVSSTQDGVRILTAHSSKGLEFKTVFVPFCIQDKAWPKRALSKLIPLPQALLVGRTDTANKDEQKKLHEYDENRLFYVAATRAKDRLVFTASPQDKKVVSRFLSEADLAPAKLTIIPEEQTILQSLSRASNVDPLLKSKEVIAGIIGDMTLSPSGLNTYLGCGRKFLYHHLLLAPQPKQQALVYGVCVHNALEKCYRRFMKEGSLPGLDYFEEQFLQLLEWEGVERDIIQGCLHKFQDAKKWYQQELANGPVQPVELEKRMTKKLQDSLIFNGQFDKVEQSDNGLVVVDYKTGEPDKHIKKIENCTDLASSDCDDYLRQLVAYKMLYDSRYKGRKVTSGQLVFLDPVKATVKKYSLEKDTFVKRTIALTNEMVKEYEQLLGNAWSNIRDLQFDKLSEYDDKQCGHCPYSGVCWK